MKKLDRKKKKTLWEALKKAAIGLSALLPLLILMGVNRFTPRGHVLYMVIAILNIVVNFGMLIPLQDVELVLVSDALRLFWLFFLWRSTDDKMFISLFCRSAHPGIGAFVFYLLCFLFTLPAEGLIAVLVYGLYPDMPVRRKQEDPLKRLEKELSLRSVDELILMFLKERDPIIQRKIAAQMVRRGLPDDLYKGQSLYADIRPYVIPSLNLYNDLFARMLDKNDPEFVEEIRIRKLLIRSTNDPEVIGHTILTDASGEVREEAVKRAASLGCLTGFIAENRAYEYIDHLSGKDDPARILKTDPPVNIRKKLYENTEEPGMLRPFLEYETDPKLSVYLSTRLGNDLPLIESLEKRLKKDPFERKTARELSELYRRNGIDRRVVKTMIREEIVTYDYPSGEPIRIDSERPSFTIEEIGSPAQSGEL